MPNWSPGKRVVVLGAGATRGAEFVVAPPSGKPAPSCLPPLNADFFTQLQRITKTKHRAEVRAVIKDVVGIYGPNFSLTLEEYFTQLEAMIATVENARSVAPGFNVDQLEARRTRLLVALSAVLEESSDVAKNESIAREHPCSYHAALVDVLEPRDTIISFNYDCVMDHALRTGGDGKWSAKYGYAFPNANRVSGFPAWNATNPPQAHNQSVNLLKLHGSINWFPFPDDNKKPLRLRERPYKQAGEKLYEIVPPEYSKTVGSRPVFRALLSNAELALRRAEVIAFVGFSFTPTDLDVEALFRLALAGNGQRLRRIVVANRSDEHRRRIRTILAPSLRHGATLTQFDDLKEFAPHVSRLMA